MPWTAFVLSWRLSFPFASHERFGNYVSGGPTFFVSKLKTPFLPLYVEKEMLFFTGYCCYHPHPLSECNPPARQINNHFHSVLLVLTYLWPYLFLHLHGHYKVTSVVYEDWSVSVREWSLRNFLILWIKDLKGKSMAIATIYTQYMPWGPLGSWAIIDQTAGTEDYMQEIKSEQCHDLENLELGDV